MTKAWNEISPEIILKSFLKCRISSNLDRTENNDLWRKMMMIHTDKEDELKFKQVSVGITKVESNKLFYVVR